MNKLFTKLAAGFIGLTMVASVGAVIGSKALEKNAVEANAATQQWELVSSELSDWSGEYILCSGNSNTVKYLDGSSFSLGANAISGVDVTVVNNTISVDDTNSIVIAKSTTQGKYTVMLNGIYIGKNANSNGIDSSKTWTSNYDNQISYSNNKIEIKGNGGKVLTWLGSNSNFKYYAASNNCSQLFKKAGSSKTVQTVAWKTNTDINKKNYFVGDSWDLTGLEVTVTYDDLSSEDIGIANCSNITVTPSSPELGIESISVSCSYKDVTVSSPITINGISVSVAPSKTTIDTSTLQHINGTPTANLLSYKNGNQVFNSNKNNSTTSALNYYPGTPSKTYTSTRSYNGMILEYDAGVGNAVTMIDVLCSTVGYATDLAGSNWSNGTASVSASNTKLVTYTANITAQVVTVSLTATVGYESISIYYVENTSPTISINKLSDHISIDGDGKFTATTNNATNPEITWFSSDDNILLVDSDGSYVGISYGVVEVTASMTCDESSTPIVDKCEAIVDAGLISIQEANNIASSLASGSVTKFSVRIEGKITNLDADAGKTSAITLTSDDKSSSIMIYGIYSKDPLRTYAIINSEATFEGNLQRYNTTNEMVSPKLIEYTDDAIVYSQLCNEYLSDKFADCSITASDWDDIKEYWNNLDEYAQNRLTSATTSDVKTDIGTWVDHYDKIVLKLHYNDFMSRSPANLPRISNSMQISNNDYTALIVIVSVIGLTAVGAFFYIRRRRQHN